MPLIHVYETRSDDGESTPRVCMQVVKGFVGGCVIGAAIFSFSLLIPIELRFVSDFVFSVGAILFGFGLMGWAVSILLTKVMQNRLANVSSDWSEQASRRAMTLIGGFGLGLMLGTTLMAIIFKIV